MEVFEEDALDKGRQALAKVVARERKKAARAAAAAKEALEEEASESETSESSGEEEADEAPLSTLDYESAVTQARRVMWACCAVVLFAVAIEVLGIGAG